MLDIIMDRQLELQRESFGVDPVALQGEARDRYIQAMSTALMVELGEALQEISWKPWASGRYFNVDAYIEELIDVLHFWTNLMLVATDDPEEVLTAYMKKADVNRERQRDGYTGTDKCEKCGR